jgi:acetyl esterase/lipase
VFLQDSAQAVAAARKMAPSWGGDPHRLVLAGHSAGAWIAAMLALDPTYLAAAGDSRDRIAGMVGLAGPYDFLPIVGADIQRVFAAAPDKRDTQPIHFADGHNPPLLLLQGADDDTVYPRNALALATRVTAAGGAAEAKIYPGVGHVGIVIGVTPLFRFKAPVLDDVTRFVLELPAR